MGKFDFYLGGKEGNFGHKFNFGPRVNFSPGSALALRLTSSPNATLAQFVITPKSSNLPHQL